MAPMEICRSVFVSQDLVLKAILLQKWGSYKHVLNSTCSVWGKMPDKQLFTFYMLMLNWVYLAQVITGALLRYRWISEYTRILGAGWNVALKKCTVRLSRFWGTQGSPLLLKDPAPVPTRVFMPTGLNLTM